MVCGLGVDNFGREHPILASKQADFVALELTTDTNLLARRVDFDQTIAIWRPRQGKLTSW
jgi:hypothetical protein